MATQGQIITEFLVRAEAYIRKNIPQILEDLDDGYENAWERLAKAYDLYSFLIELQNLYNDWNDRECLSMIDYFDSTYNLKALQSTIPDPYKSYANNAVTLQNLVSLEVPAGDGLLLQQNGSIVLYPNDNEIESYYGLE